MAKPNVNFRTREVGWVFGNTNGSATNIGAGGQAHGVAPALGAGSTAFTYAVQTAHGILGGASSFSRGFVFPATLRPTRTIDQVKDTHCRYLDLSAHLRSAGNVDLPGRITILHSDLWPDAASVPNPSRVDLGDWVSNQWQEWEKWSPLTIPTPPPGFTSGGNGGIRYEWRQYIGLLPFNFVWISLTNLGSVSATEWGIGVWSRSNPEGR